MSDLAVRRIEIDMPQGTFSALRKAPDEFAREMRLAAVAKWYEIGPISAGHQ